MKLKEIKVAISNDLKSYEESLSLAIQKDEEEDIQKYKIYSMMSQYVYEMIYNGKNKPTILKYLTKRVSSIENLEDNKKNLYITQICNKISNTYFS